MLNRQTVLNGCFGDRAIAQLVCEDLKLTDGRIFPNLSPDFEILWKKFMTPKGHPAMFYINRQELVPQLIEAAQTYDDLIFTITDYDDLEAKDIFGLISRAILKASSYRDYMALYLLAKIVPGCQSLATKIWKYYLSKGSSQDLYLAVVEHRDFIGNDMPKFIHQLALAFQNENTESSTTQE